VRKVIATVVLLCLAYFVLGWVAVFFGAFKEVDYFAYTGLVGGVASVAGLVAFFRPSISKSDIDAVGIEGLKSLTRTAEELKALEEAQSKAKGELGDLEIKKKEMELLVKKASLALFLREQHSYHVQQIEERIASDDKLVENLRKLGEVKTKLHVLNEEINSSPNVELVRQVIASADSRPNTLPVILRLLLGIFGVTVDIHGRK
jgi:hypothetical protein